MSFDFINFVVCSAIPGDLILVDGADYQYWDVGVDDEPSGNILWRNRDIGDTLTPTDIIDGGCKVVVGFLTSLLYVNAYRVSTCWGGPEEGGWTYEVGEALASIPLAPGQLNGEEIDRISSQLEVALASEANRRQEIRVVVQRKFAENWPDERPYYE